ncbi:MAG TPA: alkaline phosphatase family protein [Solirubrobacterales bacterium]|nr:alkaline phosphatase family protein [Solirubrobacterales bacterium]
MVTRAKRHNPFAYFPSITALPRRCGEVVPATRLLADLDRKRLPAFGWFTPDVCYDGHDCTLELVDWHMWKLLPRVIHQLGPHGLLVITFDEGLSDVGCCGAPGGGHIVTILVGPDVPGGREIRQPADHYSLLASIEDRFGLPRLRLASSAQPLAPALFEPVGGR